MTVVKSRALPKDIIPKRKKGSGHPTMIKSHALKVLEKYVRKNLRLTARIIKQEVPKVACLMVQYRCTSTT
jgi:hypothetical protein